MSNVQGQFRRAERWERERDGVSHTCELKTSVRLYFDAVRVQMNKALKETNQPPPDFIWNDPTDPGPIRVTNYWSRFSKSGVKSDATLPSKEKGRIIFGVVVSNFVKFDREFKNRPMGERVDYHRQS